MKDSIETFVAITANRLGDGTVVYLTKESKDLGWSTDIHAAAIFHNSVVDRMLRLAGESVTANEVIDPYAIEIVDRQKPMRLREAIRASGGPTVRVGPGAPDGDEPDYSI